MFSSPTSVVLKDTTNFTTTSQRSFTNTFSLFKRSKPETHERIPSIDKTDDDNSTTLDIKQQQQTQYIRQLFLNHKQLSRHSFTLQTTLGTGTFGRVRLVTYNDNGQQYTFALKILKKSEILRLKQVEHIKAEKAILSTITHNYIVQLYTSFQDPTHIYMVMEYVCGGELFSQLRKVGRFTEQTARFYVCEILLALGYLHEHNIVYRDLKPENLLIDKDGHIKITDFGFAKVVHDRTWTLCGTPEYLAPEIIQSKGHSKSVDYWAVGVLLFEMLAGYPPFYDENPFGIYQKILQCKIEFPKHFTNDARDLIKKLLTIDRSKRIGCLVGGIEDIKQHKFFAKIEWSKVAQKKLKPPYIPHVSSNIDTSNFDTYPDSDTDNQPKTLTDAEKAIFADF